MMKYFQKLFTLFNIVCVVHGQTSGDLQLLDVGNQTGGIFGRLEIFMDGQWGTVCTTGFDERDAQVACRQLGFDNYISEGRTINRLLVISPDVPIWLNFLDCNGTESRLLDCPQRAGDFDCDHNSDVALLCARNGFLRLINPSSNSLYPPSGRLEVLHNGVWGTVCTDRFSDPDARVACSQMGFLDFTRYGSIGALGFPKASIDTPTWLDEVRCLGAEDRLIDCLANAFGVEDCDHSQDVGLVCLSTTTTIPTTTIATTTIATTTIATTTIATTIKTTSAESVSVAAIGGGVAGGVVLIIMAALVVICVCIAMKHSRKNNTQPISVSANIPTETVIVPAGAYSTLNQKSAYLQNQSHYPMEQAAHQNAYAGQQSYPAGGYTAPPSYPPQFGGQGAYAPGPGDPSVGEYPVDGATPIFTNAPPPAYPQYHT